MNGAQKIPPNPQEWEMPNHQRGLIDDIIEEGQYEAAIEALLQLRSPQYKPSISHMRQLIFLALHPTETPPAASDERPVTETPRKARFTKASPSISPKASVSALNLLASLISTNSPDALGRALPSYALHDIREDPMDSILAKQSICIKSAKHCWELLEEGFVFRNQVVLSPKGKSKLRRDYSIDEVIRSESPSRTETIVADDSWPFLDWIVSLFEGDEDLREQKDQLRYSSLFLEQLPPPRGGSTTRWDFSAINNIILYALSQTELRRQRIGYRLMQLLINLTNTIHVELSMLVNSVYKSLLAAWNNPQRFQDFLFALSSTSSSQRFKVYFCQQLLNDAKSPATLKPNERPRPQARVAPKPRTLGASDGPRDPVVDLPSSPQIASKQTLLTCTEMLQCLDFPLPQFFPASTNPGLVLFARFQLVSSFAALQGQQPPPARLEWDRLIQEGRLTDSLIRGFPRDQGDEASLYSQMLRESLHIPLQEI